MRSYQKKAIASYLIVLLVVSFLISLLIINVTKVFFGEDIEECKYIEYEFMNVCKEGKGINLEVQNKGSKSLELLINGKRDPNYVVKSGENKKLILLNKDSNGYEFLPIIVKGDRIYECKGKKKYINSEVLLKC